MDKFSDKLLAGLTEIVGLRLEAAEIFLENNSAENAQNLIDEWEESGDIMEGLVEIVGLRKDAALIFLQNYPIEDARELVASWKETNQGQDNMIRLSKKKWANENEGDLKKWINRKIDSILNRHCLQTNNLAKVAEKVIDHYKSKGRMPYRHEL